MKRTRAQQPKVGEPQDAATGAANPKPQRRAKQPRQPKAGGGGGGAKTTKNGAAGTRITAVAAVVNAAAAAAASANAGGSAASSAPSSPDALLPEMSLAQTVPDVCVMGRRGGGEGGDDTETGARTGAVDWDLDDDAGMNAAAAEWWTWGVDEEKLLGWFPFVEEDFRCAGGRAGDAEVTTFDHDIWSIW